MFWFVPDLGVDQSLKRAYGVGQVVKGGKTLKVGDFVHGTFGWQEYALLKESAVQKVMYVEHYFSRY